VSADLFRDHETKMAWYIWIELAKRYPITWSEFWVTWETGIRMGEVAGALLREEEQNIKE